ncbi:MAG: hypothetical protein M1837_000182 [Sclerophora amabilis]|nr:MAG: hypothetical protein M1837_000182 [Sclerophora amabilis]
MDPLNNLEENTGFMLSPHVSPIRKRKAQTRLGQTRPTDSDSSEEFALKTPKKPLQLRASSDDHDSQQSSPETIKHESESGITDADSVDLARMESQNATVNSGSAPGDAWSSSSESNSDDGKEVFNPLDERALGKLPARLRDGMRGLQEERMERRNQQLEAGVRIVTPSDNESIKQEEDQREPNRTEKDGISYLNSVSLNRPSRHSSSATAPRILRVINKSDNASSASTRSEIIANSEGAPSFVSSEPAESIVPMEHWKNESDRIGLSQPNHNPEEPLQRYATEEFRSNQNLRDTEYSTEHPHTPRPSPSFSFRERFRHRFGGSERPSRDGNGKSYLNRIFRRGTVTEQQHFTPSPSPPTQQIQSQQGQHHSAIGESMTPSGSTVHGHHQRPPATRQGNSAKEMTFRGKVEGYN